MPLEDHDFPHANVELPLRPLGVIHHCAACFINSDGNLVKIVHAKLEIVRKPPAQPSSESFTSAIGATKALSEGLVFTSNSPGGEPHRRVQYVVGGNRCVRLEDCYERFEPAGPGGPIFIGVRGIVSSMVWQGADGRWFFKPTRPPETVPAGYEVFGVIERGECQLEANLAVVDPSRMSIGCFVENAFHAIHNSSDPIAIAATSTAARQVAYLTESGALVVFASDSGIELLRVPADEA